MSYIFYCYIPLDTQIFAIYFVVPRKHLGDLDDSIFTSMVSNIWQPLGISNSANGTSQVLNY